MIGGEKKKNLQVPARLQRVGNVSGRTMYKTGLHNIYRDFTQFTDTPVAVILGRARFVLFSPLGNCLQASSSKVRIQENSALKPRC